MKRKLLLVFIMLQAMLTSMFAYVQLPSEPSVIPQAKTMVTNKQHPQRSFHAVAPRQDLEIRSYIPIDSKHTINPNEVKPITHVKSSSIAPLTDMQSQTIEKKEYYAHGIDYYTNEPIDWVMLRSKAVVNNEETLFFVNIVPLLETLSELYPDGIDVEYEQKGNTITVKPQVIGSVEGDNGTEYIILSSGTSQDGNIVLTEDQYGLVTIEGESIIIGAWSTSEFDPSYASYLGGYLYIDNPTYRLPDAPAVAPKDVAFEPEELVLFAGLGYSGYSYSDNRAVIGAYAPTNFRNLTFDIATDFDWSVKESNDGVETTISGGDRNFSLLTKGGAVYSDFSLTAYNQKEASEPYKWGTGHCQDNDGSVRYNAIHAYAGEEAHNFEYRDGSYAVMTRQNPDYDLTFYINWSTPDIYSQYSSSATSIATIYSYQGKPATPLYLTGVTLPLVSFNANDDFNLHIKLCKCSRNARGNLTLGDVIAEGDATLENVNDDYDAGITAVEFTELYVEDEFGMSETVDYLFIEDEFVIVIEGWDNGTFSGVLGSQEYNFNENTSTWFQATGETRLRSYSGGWPQLFIGLLDATYGYLYTDDDTNLIFAKEGGTSTIHIDPMCYSIDDETLKPTYNLHIDSVFENGKVVDDIPEWVSFNVANEDYTTATEIDDNGQEYTYFVNGIDYDLQIKVEVLPEGVRSRTAQIVFFQAGAKLNITINQKPVITFADANVKALCVKNWDTNGDDELSEEEAAAVTSLGNVFQSNPSIKTFDELQYFTGLTSIGSCSFLYCTGLTSIIIPESVTSIGNSAFCGCSGLTSVTIPSNVTYIGDQAFYNCTNLILVKVGKTIPVFIDENTFGNRRKAILQVPTGSKVSYQTSNYWKDFKKIVEYIECDVNVDEQVNVVDVVDIARFVVGNPSEFFFEFLADINTDGAVNLGDAVTLVNDIAGELNFVKTWTAPSTFTSIDAINLTESNGNLSLNFENERSYTAFQFDLFVPEYVDVAQMSLNTERKQGHQLLYNKVEDGHYRVAALSTSNNEFNGNDGELLSFALNDETGEEVSIRNIHFFDANGNDYLFEDVEESITTGLTPTLSKGEGDIYDLQGRKREQMQRGANIVNGKKIMVK